MKDYSRVRKIGKIHSHRYVFLRPFDKIFVFSNFWQISLLFCLFFTKSALISLSFWRNCQLFCRFFMKFTVIFRSFDEIWGIFGIFLTKFEIFCDHLTKIAIISSFLTKCIVVPWTFNKIYGFFWFFSRNLCLFGNIMTEVVRLFSFLLRNLQYLRMYLRKSRVFCYAYTQTTRISLLLTKYAVFPGSFDKIYVHVAIFLQNSLSFDENCDCKANCSRNLCWVRDLLMKFDGAFWHSFDEIRGCFAIFWKNFSSFADLLTKFVFVLELFDKFIILSLFLSKFKVSWRFCGEICPFLP